MSDRSRWRALAWLVLAATLTLPSLATAAKKEKEPPPKREKAEGEEEEVTWDQTYQGIYLVGTGSYAVVTQPSDIEHSAEHAGDLPNDTKSHTDDSWGYGGRLGYRLMERVAVEGQFDMLNDIQVSHHVPNGKDSESTARFLTATANVKGFLLTQRFQPYVLLGAGYGYSQVDPPHATSDRSHGFAARFGVGADLYANEDVALTTELSYVLPTGDISDYQSLTFGFGLMLRFYGAK
jgi:opacity protein-like surface antigen